MKMLGIEPFIHPTAKVQDSALGRYTEVGAGCIVSHSLIGDYSYCVSNTQIAYSSIGKFANIAAHVRIYASMHPMERASLHHFT
jgi:UDP-3-O-[3-hydroxymyristoyl] glucosamine N-acyltransferase